MSNIQHVGIVARDYNNRGLIIHNANTSPLVRQSNGTLWALIKEHTVNYFNSLYRSQDLGFSWERVWAGTFTQPTNRKSGAVTGLNQNGPWVSLTCHEQENRIIFWESYYDVSIGEWDLEPFSFKITDPTVRIADAGEVPATNKIEVKADEGAIIVVANDDTVFIVTTSLSFLKVMETNPTYTALTEPQPIGNATSTDHNYYNVFHCCVDRNGNVDIIVLQDDGLNLKLMHVPYSHAAQNFGTPSVIANITAKPDVLDPCISKDGNGNLLAVWGQKNVAGTDMDTWMAVSNDNGLTWTVSVINKSAGHAVYTDAATGQLATRSTCTAGLSGFLISYCNDVEGVPTTFVRQLTTIDNVHYTLGPEAQIATKTTTAGEAVTGLRWFQPAGARLVSLDDPGLVRVAFQVGEGDSTTQSSSKPIRIGQELLEVSAYPTPTPGYTLDLAHPNQMVVNLDIIGGPNENLDYYTLGSTVVGHVTQRFLAAFQRIGTEMRFLRYDPIQLSELNDRAAYGAPVEFTSLAVLQTVTYAEPTSNSGLDGFRQYIERDVRQIFLPPDFALTRDFVVNKSNFLKRTVWLVEFDGNFYELTQVVPEFMNHQICFYRANAYVVGPMSDPFSKSILPTET